jgi:hypothetical protein
MIESIAQAGAAMIVPTVEFVTIAFQNRNDREPDRDALESNVKSW